MKPGNLTVEIIVFASKGTLKRADGSPYILRWKNNTEILVAAPISPYEKVNGIATASCTLVTLKNVTATLVQNNYNYEK